MPRSLLLLALVPMTATADVVRLRSGGALRGEVLREEGLPRSTTAVRTRWGPIHLDRAIIAGLETESPAATEYRRRAPRVADNASAQYTLAMWCRDNGLAEEMRSHLGRVINLDPNHEEARQLLGYQRVGEHWLTREDRLARRGMIRDRGEFRTAQEVELLERQSRNRENERLWKERLERWRNDLLSNDREIANSALNAFATLSDPAASAQLSRLLEAETNPRVRMILIRSAGQIGNAAILHALVGVALSDPDPEIRASAVEQLVANPRPGITQPFVAALRSGDNATINRSAEALGSLGSADSLEPLIEALVTTHHHRVGNNSGGDTYSLNTRTGEYAFGGGGPKVVSREVRNPSVLQSLILLSGENFSYDRGRWRAWLTSRQVAVKIDLRRDAIDDAEPDQ